MGLCKSCVDKYKQKYMQRGFNEETATRMALKLLKRVRRRQRYEILKGIRNNVQSVLFRWVFLTQWRATLYASRNLHLTWVGKGFNPDYNLACAGNCQSYTCINFGIECTGSIDCQVGPNPTCGMSTCNCPAPLANSSWVSNSCTCQASGYKCTTCGPYGSIYACTNRSFTCPCGGTCGYNCNTGYTWNGSQCVASAARKSMLGDGSSMIVNNA